MSRCGNWFEFEEALSHDTTWVQYRGDGRAMGNVREATIVLGILAVASLLGVVRSLPPYLAFFISSLSIILFPGILVAGLLAGPCLNRDSVPERLAVWFVAGTGVVTIAALIGLAVHLNLRGLVVILVSIYAVVTGLLLANRRRVQPAKTASARPLNGGPHRGIIVVLLLVAVSLALLTLATPRDYDDWFYLAYMRDYLAGGQLGVEDAIFGTGPAPLRARLGGAWWVVEAILSDASGIDPIRCHQAFLPLLVLPFAVFALFTLARQVFRSCEGVLFGTCFQMLFYLSSAFPYRSAGWMVFCRIAQDKAVSCFVVVPVVTALAVRMIKRSGNHCGDPGRHLIKVYWFALITSILVHGMGPLWCGLFVVPFASVELFRSQSWSSIRRVGRLVLPIIVFGILMVPARSAVRDFVIAPEKEPVAVSGVFSNIYLPGMEFPYPEETHNPTVWILDKGTHILNPLHITRYPLAIAGVVLALGLVCRARASASSRFLLCGTLAVLLAGYTPIGFRMLAWSLTRKLVFRVTWILPWGMIIAFFLFRSGLRRLVIWAVLMGIALGLARGNPQNYVKSLAAMRARNRPSTETMDMFEFLSTEPSPQGVILASEETGRMIAGFLPHAYPVSFREFGPVGRERLRALVLQQRIDETFLRSLSHYDVRYILIEQRMPLAEALTRAEPDFVLKHMNARYCLWWVPPDSD